MASLQDPHVRIIKELRNEIERLRELLHNAHLVSMFASEGD
jgi:hypothetical protein